MKTLDLIKQKLVDCSERSDIRGFEINLEELLKESNIENASLILSEILIRRYTSYNADSTSKFMEIIIRKEPELALINFPNNYLFRAAIIKGSWELYECYIEEAIYPLLVNKSEHENFKCYMSLYNEVEKDIEITFPKLKKQIKGRDFNGVFSTYEKDQNISLIHHTDFLIMNNAIENYNSILGRNEIFKDLEKKLEE